MAAHPARTARSAAREFQVRDPPPRMFLSPCANGSRMDRTMHVPPGPNRKLPPRVRHPGADSWLQARPVQRGHPPLHSAGCHRQRGRRDGSRGESGEGGAVTGKTQDEGLRGRSHPVTLRPPALRHRAGRAPCGPRQMEWSCRQRRPAPWRPLGRARSRVTGVSSGPWPRRSSRRGCRIPGCCWSTSPGLTPAHRHRRRGAGTP